MKKSLIWRFAIIVVVCVAWGVSIFPLQEKDFFKVFREEAEPQLAKYEAQIPKLESRVEKLQQKLEGLAEGTDKYTRTMEKKQEAEEQLETYNEYLDNFDALMEEANKLLESEQSIGAPYQAVDKAAEETVAEPAIPLSPYFSVPFIPNPSNNLIISHLRNKCKAKLNLGLDLRGGTEFILRFDESKVEDVQATRDKIRDIVSRRVDGMGVANPEIKPVGTNAISLKMPTVTEGEKEDIRSTIRKAAELTFHLVHPENNKEVQKYKAFKRGNSPSYQMPNGYMYKEIRQENPDGSFTMQPLILKEKPEEVRGKHIKQAGASVDDMGKYTVNLGFNAKGAKLFADLTEENVGRRLAILLDGTPYSAPNITERIGGGQAQISGNFSPEEVQSLSTIISSGNLPVKIQIDSEFGTDPTLGKAAINSGTMAVVGGLIAVLIFVVIYYRLAGVIAGLALILNLILILGTLALTHATLTLPGIAGIVLTIGMAVDANVLIFERIREELGKGKSMANSLHAGYSRAFLTIFDANLTTFITAVILMNFGTGAIRGFAVTLCIGVIASMFSALFMTRAVFDLFIYLGKLNKLSMLCFVKDPKLPFMSGRKVAAGISVVLIGLSLVWTGIRGSDSVSIDFKGGTSVVYTYEGEDRLDQQQVSKIVTAEFPDADLTYKSTATGGKRLEVLIPGLSTEQVGASLDLVTAQLKRNFQERNVRLGKTRSIGGIIGKEFRNSAFWAALWALVAIIVYISFRFELAFGVASVVALVHDVIITTGIFLMFGGQLSLTVIAALLTIIGYSLNDTIVLFDRIREELELGRKQTYETIINLSINHVLSRTVLTSLTTLIVVLALVIFGGGPVAAFAWVLLIGILVGTYSSIFVASSMITLWHKPTKADSVATSHKPAAANKAAASTASS